MAKRRDGPCALLVRIDHVFGQGADDSVPPRVNFTDSIAILSGRFDDAAGRGIDDGGDAPGLGVKGIFLRHV